MSEVTAVNEQTFESEVLRSNLPVVADLWAQWCGPCRILSPLIEEIAEEYKDRVKFVKVDVDTNPNLAMRYGVMSIPTLLYFRDGEPVGQTIGAIPKNVIVAKIEEFFGLSGN